MLRKHISSTKEIGRETQREKECWNGSDDLFHDEAIIGPDT